MALDHLGQLQANYFTVLISWIWIFFLFLKLISLLGFEKFFCFDYWFRGFGYIQ